MRTDTQLLELSVKYGISVSRWADTEPYRANSHCLSRIMSPDTYDFREALNWAFDWIEADNITRCEMDTELARRSLTRCPKPEAANG